MLVYLAYQLSGACIEPPERAVAWILLISFSGIGGTHATVLEKEMGNCAQRVPDINSQE